MKRCPSRGALLALLATTMLAAGASRPADACTRPFYVGDDTMVITGRNMDWEEDMASSLWIPAGRDEARRRGGLALHRLDLQIRQRDRVGLQEGHDRRHEQQGPRRQPAVSRGVGLWRPGEDRAAAVDLHLGAVRARQLRHGRGGRGGAARRALQHAGAPAAERRGGHAAPVDLGRDGRFRHLRICRGQARHPSQRGVFRRGERRLRYGGPVHLPAGGAAGERAPIPQAHRAAAVRPPAPPPVRR